MGHSVELLAQIDGIVTEIAYDQDSWVEKGAVLARIDDRELQAKLNHARDNLEIAQNNLKYQEAETKAKDAAYRRQLELRKYGLSSQAAEEEAEFSNRSACSTVTYCSKGASQRSSDITVVPEYT